MVDLPTKNNKDLIAQGLIFNQDPDDGFNKDRPWVSCQLCGAVYQGPLDLRVPPGHLPENSMIAKLAQNRRNEWALKHSKTHSEHEHNMYRLSGRFATPEAAQKLAARGIMSIVDMVMDDEVENALKEGKPVPIDEVQN